MKFLVVDDEPFSRSFVVTLLQTSGVCHEAGSGNEAILKFKSALCSDEPYDLVVMDIMMPGMGGHQAVEAIRTIEKTQKPEKPVAIVVLTGLTSTDDTIEEFCKAQAATYLVKPVSRAAIQNTLSAVGLG